GMSENALRADFSNFQLATITGFIKADSVLLNGSMNGNITFMNLAKQPLFTSDLVINDFSMRQDTLGNIALQVESAAANRYTVRRATLTGRGNDVSASGTLFPQGNDMGMNLDVAIRQLQLNTLEGAMASAITNASGYVNGNVRVIGTLGNPDIEGQVRFNDTRFNLTLLGSQFAINDEELRVTEDGFVFQSFSIRDSANNSLTLNGTVGTSNFVNYRFNLYATADNFQILNTPRRPNSIYWGRLNISSELFIGGTEVRPLVDGALTVNDGTSLTVVIPQRNRGYEEREGIVEFVDMDATVDDSLFRRYDSLNYTSVLGFDVTANIEIRKEAIFNIIVDEANGDFLNVRGEALLSAGVDPSGKITLVGNYQLEEGAYELSFSFLRRRFEIEKGSTITWTGTPTTANLNVKAVYIANTAPIDLVADQIEASTDAIRNTYQQKLPFEVHLSLTGELMRPVVDFDILLPESKNYGVSNDIVIQVQSRLAQLRVDEGEINKQVFSLLLLNRFVGEDPFNSTTQGFSAGTYARQSVSKLMTEQLNRIAGGLIQGVDIDFNVVSSDDYSTGDKRSRTDLNVGLSKRLLNERLIITVGSNFELQGQQATAQRNNNIAGNVAVGYQLSRDGRYMIRFFRRNEYVGVLDGYIIETGLGFSLNIDYNKFQEVLKRRKQRVETQGTN
ncbi:MAG TPA: translocation/assembly module TamB domain-containing protein, partial [Flavisolibacter sp.]